MKPAPIQNTDSRSKFKRWLLAPFIYVAAILLLLEDWLWDISTRALSWLSKLPIVARIEARISRLPPYAAMAVFILPAALLFPVKIVALVAIAKGHASLGVIVIVLAKIGGAALTARLYQLTLPNLLSLAWFSRFHAGFIRIKNRLIARLRATTAWHQLHRFRITMRRLWRNWRAAFLLRFANGKLLRLIRKFSAKIRFRKRE